MRCLKIICFLLMSAFVLSQLNSCRKDNPVEPEPAPTVQQKGVVFTSPDTNTSYWWYETVDTIRWRVHPDSTIERVRVELERYKTGSWRFFFDARADSGIRSVPVDFTVGTSYRFRIRNANGGEWDTSRVVNVVNDSTLRGYAFLFPRKNSRIYTGWTIKVQHQLPLTSDVVVSFTNRPVKEQKWEVISSDSSWPFWKIEERYLNGLQCYLKIQYLKNGKTGISEPFSIYKGPDPKFRIISPKKSDTFINGQVLPIQYTAEYGPVAFDLSTDDGTTWRELIHPDRALVWVVNVNIPYDRCRLRMRMLDTSIAITGQQFTLDTASVHFDIVHPSAGDVVLPGDYLTVNYKNTQGGDVTFSLSLDDGKTWERLDLDIHTREPYGCNVPDTTYKWFVVQGPAPACRLKMASKDGSRVTVSGRFSIDDDLADFMPLRVGKVFVYLRYWGQMGNQRMDLHQYTRTIEVLREWSTSDTKYYQCKVLDVNDDGTVINTEIDTVAEELSGLHRIHCILSPFRSGLPRYFSSRLDRVARGIDCYFRSKYFAFQKNVGIQDVIDRRRTGMYQWYVNNWSLKR